MLKQRILTALVLGGIFISAIFTGSGLLFISLVVITILFSAWEWAALCNIEKKFSRLFYAFFTAGLMVIFYLLVHSTWTVGVPAFGLLWWCFATVMVFCFQTGKQIIPASVILQLLIGCCVLIPAALCLIYLYESENTRYFVLLFFILIWITDSSAFFIGRQWGNRRLADRVSPGKSLEGFLGSLLAVAIAAGVYSYIEGIAGIEILWVFVLFIITAGFSVIGDLFESMFKRHANIKDSSELLPGHGGMLDRIDSLTAAAPVFVLGLRMLEGKI